jgi:hypothetical protein
MSDIVEKLQATTDICARLRVTGMFDKNGAVMREAADEIERLRALRKMDSDSSWSWLCQYQEKVDEIDRLRAALDVVRASGLLIGSTTLYDRVRAVVHAALDERT